MTLGCAPIAMRALTADAAKLAGMILIYLRTRRYVAMRLTMDAT